LHFYAAFIRSSSSSSPGGLILWCLAGLCAGLYLSYRGFQLLQRRHLILDTPFSKIRSAAMGLVEMSGLAAGPYTMNAPITARPCYYYRTLVWEWKQRGKNKQWVKVVAESVHLPFFLDDNTGLVLVDPRQAELDLHRDFEEEYCDSFFTVKEPAPDNVRSFLARHGIATRNKIKVEEYCIKPKNALFILGTLAENLDVEVTAKPVWDTDTGDVVSPLSRLSLSGGSLFSATLAGAEESRFDVLAMSAVAPAQQVIRLSPAAAPAQAAQMSQQEKIAAAMMKAGITNPAAWSAAGLGAAPVTLSPSPAAAANSAFVPHPPVALMKGTNDRAFMISWRSQRELARSLGWKCTLMIWGGPALSLLSLYVLIEGLHFL
jgi:E3 Ubiquitin ligase